MTTLKSYDDNCITIGILALQGAFTEHKKFLDHFFTNIKTRLIRNSLDLTYVDALILPGGESTSQSILSFPFLQKLRSFITSHPTWGTCAGIILLSKHVLGYDCGSLSCLNIKVVRNYFGSQISSCECDVSPPPSHTNDNRPFPGVFIRAPGIISCDKDMDILGTMQTKPCEQAKELLETFEDYDVNDNKEKNVIIAGRNENILITAFHPELTDDYRWHEYFVNMVIDFMSKTKVENN